MTFTVTLSYWLLPLTALWLWAGGTLYFAPDPIRFFKDVFVSLLFVSGLALLTRFLP